MSWIGDAFDTVVDAGASMLGVDGPSQSNANQQQYDQANQRGNQQRGQYNNQAKQYEQQAGGGYDPAKITTQTNWAAKDHSAIKQVADGLKPEDLDVHSSDWSKLGADLQTSVTDFNTKINSALNGNWTGAAGDAALAAPQGIVDWGQNFGDQMKATSAQAKSVQATADQVKSTVPPPKDFSWGQTALSGIAFGPFGAGASAFAQHQEQQEAKEQAVRVMSSVYSPNYMNAANTMPAFTGPTDPTQPPGSNPPPPPIIGPPPGPGPYPPQPPGGRTKYNPNQVGGTNNPGSNQQGQHLNQPPGYQQQPILTDQNGSLPPVPPTGTTTQSTNYPGIGQDGNGQYVPNPPGYPGSGGGGRGGGQGGGGFMPPMGGGGFGGGGGGGYGAGGGAGGFGAGGAKGFGSGATSGASARPGAGAAAGFGAEEEGGMRGGGMAGRPGAAGAAGQGGMGAGGRGGKKEEDKEHKSAAYLVNDDNANDIVGDLPPTVPPVIGG